MDLGFLIDRSKTIGKENFLYILRFATEMVEKFDVSKTGTHIGVVLFDDKPKVSFNFDEIYDKKEVKDKIFDMQTEYSERRANTGNALNLARTDLYATSKRLEVVPKVLVVLSGESQDEVTDPAKRLRKDGVTIFAVGVRETFNARQLNDMATDPDSEHVFKSDRGSLDNLVDAICNGELFLNT